MMCFLNKQNLTFNQIHTFLLQSYTYILSTVDKPLCRFPKFFVDTFKKLQSKNESAYPQKLIFCPTAEEISTYSNDNNTFMRARGYDSMASLTSMTCDDDLRGACSKGWEPPFIGDKEEMERLSKLRKIASLPYIHQRNPSFSYKSKGIWLMVDHINIWENRNISL